MGVAGVFGAEPAQPIFTAGACQKCDACIAVCPCGILSRLGDLIHVDRDRYFGCIGCAQCAMACPTGSLTVVGRRTGPADLVPLPRPETRATHDQLEALLLSRRSVRRFTSAPVPRSVLDRVVSVAATAPMGIPPWEVGLVVLEGREKVRALAEDVVGCYRRMLAVLDRPGVLPLLRLFMKKSRHDQWRTFLLPLGRALVAEHRQGRDAVLYEAPAALLFCGSPYADAADSVIACTYAMLAAEAMGLGSCMLGCVAPPLAMRRSLLDKYRIPKGHTPAIVLILGYPAVRYARAVRRAFASVSYC